MTAVATRAALTRLSRPLRLRAGIGWTGVAVGTAGLLLGVMAWTVRLGVVATPWWVFAAWGLALAALTGSGVAAWRALRALSVRRVARRLEDTGLTRQGSLTALLESPAPGTSETLYAQADQGQAAELRQRGGAWRRHDRIGAAKGEGGQARKDQEERQTHRDKQAGNRRYETRIRAFDLP